MNRIRPTTNPLANHERPPWPDHERRCVRTDAAAEAVELALTWSVARGELVAIVMADEEGMMVCKSQGDVDLSSVAAVLPLVAQGRAKARVSHHGQPFPIVVRRFQIRHETFYMGVLGGSAATREREAIRAVSAAVRILG